MFAKIEGDGGGGVMSGGLEDDEWMIIYCYKINKLIN